MGVVELYMGQASYKEWLKTRDEEGHVMGTNPSPYDNWERFKLTPFQKLSLFLLSKKERKETLDRVDAINEQRRKDLEDKIRANRPKTIPGQPVHVKPPRPRIVRE